MAAPQTPEELLAALRAKADALAEKLDADIFVYNGALFRPHDEQLLEECSTRRRRTNVFCSITTSGGDPNVAYRIGRALQMHYKKVIAFVPGYCKSAGTLLVLAAHELVLADHAELGPLDIQAPGDEVGERSSALAPGEGLMTIEMKAIDAFETAFQRMREIGLSTAMAADKATVLAAQLYEPLMRQIDPVRLGELDRANRIMIDYAQRLLDVSNNADRAIAFRLAMTYPSHGFVIDRTEASKLFKSVRQPTPEEVALAMRTPLSEEKAVHMFFNTERVNERQNGKVEAGGSEAASGDDSGNGPRGTPSPTTPRRRTPAS